MRDITPIFEITPPLTFQKLVTMTLRTCISAPAGKRITASLFTRYFPEEQWQETKKLILEQRNEVVFKVIRCGGMKVTAECSEAVIHLINGFHINLEVGTIALTYCKDHAVYDILKRAMEQRNYVDFAVMPHEVQAKFGSRISVSMKQKEFNDIVVSQAYPRPNFTLDEDFLRLGKQIVYFQFDPEPLDSGRMISMEYEYTINGQLEQRLPLRIKLPRKDPVPEPDVQVVEEQQVEVRRRSRFNLTSKFRKLWR